MRITRKHIIITTVVVVIILGVMVGYALFSDEKLDLPVSPKSLQLSILGVMVLR